MLVGLIFYKRNAFCLVTRQKMHLRKRCHYHKKNSVIQLTVLNLLFYNSYTRIFVRIYFLVCVKSNQLSW